MPDLILWTDHALKRARERHGVDVQRAEQIRLFLAITEGRALLLRRTPDGREEFAMEVQGTALRLIYDPFFAMVITVLPGVRTPLWRQLRRPGGC